MHSFTSSSEGKPVDLNVLWTNSYNYQNPLPLAMLFSADESLSPNNSEKTRLTTGSSLLIMTSRKFQWIKLVTCQEIHSTVVLHFMHMFCLCVRLIPISLLKEKQRTINFSQLLCFMWFGGNNKKIYSSEMSFSFWKKRSCMEP